MHTLILLTLLAAPGSAPAELHTMLVGSTPAPPPAAPVQWRMADHAGRIWEHPDPAVLRQYIAQLRATPAPRPVARPLYQQFGGYQFSGGCTTGQCPR